MPFSIEWMRIRYSMRMRSGRARLNGRFERAIIFDPTVGSRSNFYWSFWIPFCMEWMGNRYSVMMRPGRARLDGRFAKAITFDPTVGSR
jgi:cell wall assembly regulator SMI1